MGSFEWLGFPDWWSIARVAVAWLIIEPRLAIILLLRVFLTMEPSLMTIRSLELYTVPWLSSWVPNVRRKRTVLNRTLWMRNRWRRTGGLDMVGIELVWVMSDEWRSSRWHKIVTPLNGSRSWLNETSSRISYHLVILWCRRVIIARLHSRWATEAAWSSSASA